MIDSNEFNFTFSRSSGAGGQNVNKVNTKVTLSWDIFKSKSISKPIESRFVKSFSRYITDEKIVKITSQRFRNQARNIADCVEKLNRMIEEIRIAPKKRIATKPTRSSNERRIKHKKEHSDKKKQRQIKY